MNFRLTEWEAQIDWENRKMNTRPVPKSFDWDCLAYAGLFLVAMIVAALVGCGADQSQPVTLARVVDFGYVMHSGTTGPPRINTADEPRWGCEAWEICAKVIHQKGGYTSINWCIDPTEAERHMVEGLADYAAPPMPNAIRKSFVIYRPIGPYWVPTIPGELGDRIDRSATSFRLEPLIESEYGVNDE